MKKIAFKKLIGLSVTVVASLLISAQSMAGGPDVAPQDTVSFTGLYLGGGLGFRAVDYTLTNQRNGAFFSNDETNKYHVAQATQEVHLGYGYEFANNIYLGLVGNVDFAEGIDKVSDSFLQTISFAHELEFQQMFGVNGNFGYAITPRFLPYLTAGWQWQKLEDTVSNVFGALSENFSDDGYVNGPDVGLGMHYLVTQHVMVGALYSAAFYNTHKSTTVVAGATQLLKIQPNTVMTGLFTFDYLFNL